MDSNGLERRPRAAVVYRIPRSGRPEWPGVIVETSQLAGLALWSGLLLAAAAVVPRFGWRLLPALEATSFLSQFSGFINLLGSGIGAFLLVTGLLQHTLELRHPRIVVVQMCLFLLMTLTLVGSQLFLVQELESTLRLAQLPEEATAETLAKARSLQEGVQGLHLFAFLLTLAAFVVGWTSRPRVRRQTEPVQVFKLQTWER